MNDNKLAKGQALNAYNFKRIIHAFYLRKCLRVANHIFAFQFDGFISIYSLLKIIINWLQVLVEELEMVAGQLLA